MKLRIGVIKMSILGRLSELFFSSPTKPVEDAAAPVHVDEPEATAPELATVYTDDEIATVMHRGQAVKAMFDDALTRTNQSTSRKDRTAFLEIARARLVTLKHFTTEFPFFHLTNLPAVEACILALEAETRGMDDDELTERTTSSATRYSENDETAMLDSIQTSFKVITESIALARNSKNLDTKVSRLRVARTRLTEARTQAERFSLDVRGFDEAEIEISRIEEALRNGTPTEIHGMLHIEEPTLASEAYSLLREATVLKRARRFWDACEKLRQAYAAPGAENLLIEDRLRLPMYLQLAGKNDDGWDELNRLATQYTDPFSQPRIAHQRTVFLRKENNVSATNPVRVVAHSDEKMRSAATASSSTSIAALQNAPMPDFMSDICKGMQFHATLQLRTPLRVIRRHGEQYLSLDGKQPRIAQEQWEGIWVILTKTWKELSGVDIPEFTPSVASDVGLVMAADYLPFLIALREAVESDGTIDQRIKALEALGLDDRWSKYLSEHGGIDSVVAHFFPAFLDTLPTLNAEAAEGLSTMGLDTPNKLAAAPDEMLLAIKGIGSGKLRAIRTYCIAVTNNRDDCRMDRVIR